MNQIHAMRVFVRVSEAESFRRANALVTRAIAILEAHLRTRLINLKTAVSPLRLQ
jgi:DNA-binding transcriptional LysR family regulator